MSESEAGAPRSGRAPEPGPVLSRRLYVVECATGGICGAEVGDHCVGTSREDVALDAKAWDQPPENPYCPNGPHRVVEYVPKPAEVAVLSPEVRGRCRGCGNSVPAGFRTCSGDGSHPSIGTDGGTR